MIIGHTNEPEYRKLQSNEFMEALRDRTIKIDIPYVTKLSEETQDLREGLQQPARPRQAHRPAYTGNRRHVGPFDSRGWKNPKTPGLTLLQKLKLYNGKTLPGFTSDNVVQLAKRSPQRRYGRDFAALCSR